jgi:hypothetical protein
MDVDISLAPLDDNGVRYWTSRDDVYVLSISDWLADNHIAYNPALKKVYWKPENYPRAADGSFPLWGGDLIPLHPDGIPYWTPGTEIMWINYHQFWQFEEGIPINASDEIETKYFVFLNYWNWETFWDPFNPPVSLVDLNSPPNKPGTSEPYWEDKANVYVQPVKWYL